MTRKDIKEQAQDHLLFGLRTAFATLDGDEDLPEVREEMSKQMARIEKLFGYVPYSNGRSI